MVAMMKPFWGLVEQVGPWKTTRSDIKRSKMKDKPTVGGGIEAGGREHAGHGEWTQIFTPYQNDASPSIPKPSSYAMRSVVTGPIDMKRQTKMGRVKKGVTMAARTPILLFFKKYDLFTESVASASEYGVETSPGETQTVPVGTSISTTQTSGPSLSIQKTGQQAYRPSRGVQGTQTRERTFKEFGTQVVGTAAASTLGFITMNVPGAMIAGKKTYDYLAPDLKTDLMEIDVPTYKPPPVNLSLSDTFMKSIINYEEGEKVKRKEKMEKGYKERKELVQDRTPVPTGEGKKLAMSAKALGKMADKRGLSQAAKAAGIIPEKPVKTDGLKIKPIKKKTAIGVTKKSTTQPATAKVIKALRKRIGDTKINLMFRSMKNTNPQYKIFKAANEQWKKEK